MPSSWRGIAKKSSLYKLLAAILAQRLQEFLEARGVLPDEQHGFRKGKSTITACESLLSEVVRTVHRFRVPLYAVFVDFKAAFDTASRELIIVKLATAGVPMEILRLVAAILQEGQVVLDDGVKEHNPIRQTTGVAQGDNLSPLLFSVLISDLPSVIQERHKHVKVLLYADDLVLSPQVKREHRSES